MSYCDATSFQGSTLFINCECLGSFWFLYIVGARTEINHPTFLAGLGKVYVVPGEYRTGRQYLDLCVEEE